MRAEVIAIGDELTSGERLDTNSQWLSRQLAAMGVPVAFHTTVGDDLDDNIAVFQAAIKCADLVVTTGGLGPTADDLTRNAIAAATDTRLVCDEASLNHIQQLFASRGREMPARNQVQAYFPVGSQPIPNPNGTAPGIEMHIDNEECTLFALPGVPFEMHEMWTATVAPRIAELQPEARTIRHRCIKCFGAGESQIEAMLPDLVRRGREPKVGITASDATITLRVTATGSDEAAFLAAIEPTVATIYESLGDLIFGEDEDELQHVVLRLLEQQDLTLVVAEWATEGLITEWLQQVDRKAKNFWSANPLTTNEQIADSSNNEVDCSSAVAMAESARAQYGTKIGLAVAAFPAGLHSPDAYVPIAIAMPDKTHKLRFACNAHPAIIKTRTAKQALNALRLLLKENRSSDA